jgi:hypothetical protein
LEVHFVVRWTWVLAIDGVFGSVDIEDKVDARVLEFLHARIVVGSVVDGVDTDRVDAQLLEFGDISLADRRVGEGIRGV